jgi:predicted ATPase
MLTRVEIKGYKSLKDIELDMKELTVLIGPNGSGKSNFLDVFALMSQAAVGAFSEGIIQRGGMENVLFKQAQKQIVIGFFQDATTYHIDIVANEALPRISAERMMFLKSNSSDSLLVHRLEQNVNFYRSRNAEAKKLESETELSIFQVRDQAVYPEPYNLLRQMQNWINYTPIEVDARSPMRLPQVWRPGMRLLPDGSNLFSVLKTIQDESPTNWTEINQILKIIYEDFRYMTFPSEGGDGKILLRWWEHPFVERNYSFSADLLSDGTLRLLSLLAILKSPEPPSLICIEEPELGLHPDWIKLVGELLESAATRTQIIVATHSPILVSYVQPQHVVVVEKEDGMTYMERLTEEEMADWLDDFQLGDLWLSGQIGGRP